MGQGQAAPNLRCEADGYGMDWPAPFWWESQRLRRREGRSSKSGGSMVGRGGRNDVAVTVGVAAGGSVMIRISVGHGVIVGRTGGSVGSGSIVGQGVSMGGTGDGWHCRPRSWRRPRAERHHPPLSGLAWVRAAHSAPRPRSGPRRHCPPDHRRPDAAYSPGRPGPDVPYGQQAAVHRRVDRPGHVAPADGVLSLAIFDHIVVKAGHVGPAHDVDLLGHRLAGQRLE